MSIAKEPVFWHTVTTSSPEETVALGQEIGKLLGPGHVVALFGSLGSGKTTLVKGIAQGLGVDPRAVHSASFLLMQEYRGGRLPVYHFDAYRLEDPRDMWRLGCDELFWGEGVSIVEWADRVEGALPEEYIKISLFIEAPEKRRIGVSYKGEKYRKVLEGLIALRK